MRKTMVLITTGGWLVAAGALAVEGVEKTSSPAGTAESRVFNVVNYGAVGDDKTDNTEVFSACLKAVAAAGGGKMVLPDGVYRGQITIPPVSKPLPSWITIEIIGESEPATVWGTVGSFPLQQNGTIIKSLATPGAAVISASPSPNSVFGVFSAVHVVLRNLDVRTCDNPDRDGIDLRHALQCKLENVFINTDDPDNLGSADIKYWVVEGNVGAVEKFTRNGGASIQARRIGSAPAGNK